MTDPLQHLPEGAKIAGDIVSAATVIGTLAQWLPYVAALLSIVWTILRIYDWVEARRDKRRL